MENNSVRRGLLYGVGAFGLWGVIPLFFKQLMFLSPLELLAHRVLWSLVFLTLVLCVTRSWKPIVEVYRQKAVLRMLMCSTLFIAGNWFTYLYAVWSEQILQASLGYFIAPLANVLLGFTLLGERLRPWQMVAIVLAGSGVLYMGWHGGLMPWIALTVATTFSCYGLVRKLAPVESLVGLFWETLLLAPLGLLYVVYVTASGQSGMTAQGVSGWAWVASSGVVTAIPLLFFSGAARRLRLATIGVMQFSSPTIQFLIAVWVYHEPFTQVQFYSFVCIWLAVAIYAVDSLRSARHRPPVAPLELPSPASVTLSPPLETSPVGGESTQPCVKG